MRPPLIPHKATIASQLALCQLLLDACAAGQPGLALGVGRPVKTYEGQLLTSCFDWRSSHSMKCSQFEGRPMMLPVAALVLPVLDRVDGWGVLAIVLLMLALTVVGRRINHPVL